MFCTGSPPLRATAVKHKMSNLTCEYCDLPLGLFKRKRLCPGCSRWFCTSCLPRDYSFQASNIRLGRNPLGPTPICQRCSILAIDNVTKDDLMELRVKDLRQYLESKHIPIAGCREKAELVDLVLQHCCSDAFLQQQAENQRRLRELTRRKEEEEEWEQRQGRSRYDDDDDSSPDSPLHARRPPRPASSSPATSSGADDPGGGDDISLGADMDTDPAPSHPAPTSPFHTGGDSVDAPPPDIPIVNIIEDSDDGDDAVDDVIFVSHGPVHGHAQPVPPPTGPGAPPSYEEVMAAGDDVVHVTATHPHQDDQPHTPPPASPEDTSAPIPAPPADPTPAPPAATHSSAYSSGSGGSESQPSSPSRFLGRRRIRLGELGCVDDVKELSPRQLKEILTTNFVAYKGCCERWELEDRVKRLWNEHQLNQETLRAAHERDENAAAKGKASAPPLSPSAGASSSPPAPPADVDASICKICWDAVIDCVLLECGHMVTCTDCGRRMSECPICRQYVVRAVHVFRA